MRNSKLLSVKQLDRKLKPYYNCRTIDIPTEGWIHIIRNSLNMTQEQLANKLNIGRTGVGEIEKREANGSISINSLKEVGQALDLKLIYAFVPTKDSFEKLVEDKAIRLAERIVLRTNHNMALEDQAIDNERVKESIKELAIEIKAEVRKGLWD